MGLGAIVGSGDSESSIFQAPTKVAKQAGVIIRENAAHRRSMKQALAASSTGIISEFKRRSPSKGWINEAAQAEEIPASYEAAGAAALPILPDEQFFGGTLRDIRTARPLVRIPILRKDFIIDAYQIYESRVMGADCILLIAACLLDSQMADFEAIARSLDMAVLVEVHDRPELERALKLKTPLVGINNRNLRTFEVTLDTTLGMLKDVPSDRLLVTESGILKPADVKTMRDAGVHAFLVGEAFMRADDPGLALARLFA